MLSYCPVHLLHSGCHEGAGGGDYLQYLKVKETGTGSLLLAILQSLEPHSGRFFWRIYFRHRGLVSIDLVSAGPPLVGGLEIENNLVASDSCLCVNPQIKAVPGCSQKCQFFLQNVALLSLIRTSHCYNFQEYNLLRWTSVRCRNVCLSLWRAFEYCWRVLPSFSEVLIQVPGDSEHLPVLLVIWLTHLSPVLCF